MTIAQLNYFLAVCETKNITAAAGECHISQPAMSAQMKALEDELGTQLFIRENKRIILTPAAKVLREKALAVNQAMEDLYAAANEFRKAKPLCQIGISSNCGILYQYELRDFQKKAANFQYKMQLGSSHKLYDRVRSKELDAAFLCRTEEPSDSSLSWLPLSETNMVFATYPGHQLANRTSVSIEEIAETEMIAYSESEVETADNPFLPMISSKNILFSTNQFSLIKFYITSGQASTFIMEDMICNSPEIIRIPIVGVPKIIEMLVWHRKNKNPGLRQIIDLAHKIQAAH